MLQYDCYLVILNKRCMKFNSIKFEGSEDKPKEVPCTHKEVEPFNSWFNKCVKCGELVGTGNS